MNVRKVLFAPVVLACLWITGCQPVDVEKAARDGLAVSHQVLEDAYVEYAPACRVDPSQKPCNVIIKGIQTHNLAVSALEAYCGYDATTPPDTVCKPVKSAEGALKAALSNLNIVIPQVRLLLK